MFINKFPELVDLRMRLLPHNTEECNYEVTAELRIGSIEVELDDSAYELCIKRLLLDLSLEGLEIKPNSRYGEPKKENMIETKKYNLNESVMESSGSVGAGISKNAATRATGSMKIRAQKEKQTTSRERLEKSSNFKYYRVKALPADRWLVSEPDEIPLSETYLSQDILCNVVKSKGANRTSVTIKAIVKQRDCHFNCIGNTFVGKIWKNKEKLMNIVIAKSISHKSAKYNGWIQLSETEDAIEG